VFPLPSKDPKSVVASFLSSINKNARVAPQVTRAALPFLPENPSPQPSAPISRPPLFTRPSASPSNLDAYSLVAGGGGAVLGGLAAGLTGLTPVGWGLGAGAAAGVLGSELYDYFNRPSSLPRSVLPDQYLNNPASTPDFNIGIDPPMTYRDRGVFGKRPNILGYEPDGVTPIFEPPSQTDSLISKLAEWSRRKAWEGQVRNEKQVFDNPEKEALTGIPGGIAKNYIGDLAFAMGTLPERIRGVVSRTAAMPKASARPYGFFFGQNPEWSPNEEGGHGLLMELLRTAEPEGQALEGTWGFLRGLAGVGANKPSMEEVSLQHTMSMNKIPAAKQSEVIAKYRTIGEWPKDLFPEPTVTDLAVSHLSYAVNNAKQNFSKLPVGEQILSFFVVPELAGGVLPKIIPKIGKMEKAMAPSLSFFADRNRYLKQVERTIEVNRQGILALTNQATPYITHPSNSGKAIESADWVNRDVGIHNLRKWLVSIGASTFDMDVTSKARVAVEHGLSSIMQQFFYLGDNANFGQMVDNLISVRNYGVGGFSSTPTQKEIAALKVFEHMGMLDQPASSAMSKVTGIAEGTITNELNSTNGLIGRQLIYNMIDGAAGLVDDRKLNVRSANKSQLVTWLENAQSPTSTREVKDQAIKEILDWGLRATLGNELKQDVDKVLQPTQWKQWQSWYAKMFHIGPVPGVAVRNILSDITKLWLQDAEILQQNNASYLQQFGSQLINYRGKSTKGVSKVATRGTEIFIEDVVKSKLAKFGQSGAVGMQKTEQVLRDLITGHAIRNVFNKLDSAGGLGSDITDISNLPKDMVGQMVESLKGVLNDERLMKLKRQWLTDPSHWTLHPKYIEAVSELSGDAIDAGLMPRFMEALNRYQSNPEQLARWVQNESITMGNKKYFKPRPKTIPITQYTIPEEVLTREKGINLDPLDQALKIVHDNPQSAEAQIIVKDLVSKGYTQEHIAKEGKAVVNYLTSIAGKDSLRNQVNIPRLSEGFPTGVRNLGIDVNMQQRYDTAMEEFNSTIGRLRVIYNETRKSNKIIDLTSVTWPASEVAGTAEMPYAQYLLEMYGPESDIAQLAARTNGLSTVGPKDIVIVDEAINRLMAAERTTAGKTISHAVSNLRYLIEDGSGNAIKFTPENIKKLSDKLYEIKSEFMSDFARQHELIAQFLEGSGRYPVPSPVIKTGVQAEISNVITAVKKEAQTRISTMIDVPRKPMYSGGKVEVSKRPSFPAKQKEALEKSIDAYFEAIDNLLADIVDGKPAKIFGTDEWEEMLLPLRRFPDSPFATREEAVGLLENLYINPVRAQEIVTKQVPVVRTVATGYPKDADLREIKLVIEQAINDGAFREKYWENIIEKNFIRQNKLIAAEAKKPRVRKVVAPTAPAVAATAVTPAAVLPEPEVLTPVAKVKAKAPVSVAPAPAAVTPAVDPVASVAPAIETLEPEVTQEQINAIQKQLRDELAKTRSLKSQENLTTTTKDIITTALASDSTPQRLYRNSKFSEWYNFTIAEWKVKHPDLKAVPFSELQDPKKSQFRQFFQQWEKSDKAKKLELKPRVEPVQTQLSEKADEVIDGIANTRAKDTLALDAANKAADKIKPTANKFINNLETAVGMPSFEQNRKSSWDQPFKEYLSLGETPEDFAKFKKKYIEEWSSILIRAKFSGLTESELKKIHTYWNELRRFNEEATKGGASNYVIANKEVEEIVSFSEKQIASMFVNVMENPSKPGPKTILKNFLNQTGYWKVGGVEINPTQALYKLNDQFVAKLLQEGTTWTKIRATKGFLSDMVSGKGGGGLVPPLTDKMYNFALTGDTLITDSVVQLNKVLDDPKVMASLNEAVSDSFRSTVSTLDPNVSTSQMLTPAELQKEKLFASQTLLKKLASAILDAQNEKIMHAVQPNTQEYVQGIERFFAKAESELRKTRVIAEKLARTNVDNYIYNYGEKYNFDHILEGVFGYPLWYLRTFSDYPRQILSDPNYLSKLFLWNRQLNTLNEDEDLPLWMRASAKLNVSNETLKDLMGTDTVYLPLLSQISPLESLLNGDYTNATREKSTLGKGYNALYGWGPGPHALWPLAIGTGLYATGYATSNEDLINQSSQYFGYLGSQTRLLPTITAFMEKNGYGVPLADGGVSIDAPLMALGGLGKLGSPQGSLALRGLMLAGAGVQFAVTYAQTKDGFKFVGPVYDQRRVANVLTTWGAEPNKIVKGILLTPEILQDAAIVSSDPYTLGAQKEYANAYSVWSAAVTEARSQKLIPQILSFLGGPGVSARGTNEILQEKMYDSVDKLYDLRDDPEITKEQYEMAWLNFSIEFPNFPVYSIFRRYGDEAFNVYAYSAMSRVGRGATAKAVYDTVGLNYDVVDKFYENKGKFEFGTESASFKAGIMKLALLLQSPDAATKEEWGKAGIMYHQLQREMENMFPGTSAMQDVYYDLEIKQREQFLRDHLDLKARMNTELAATLKDPKYREVMAPYYVSIKDAEDFLKQSFMDKDPQKAEALKIYLENSRDWPETKEKQFLSDFGLFEFNREYNKMTANLDNAVAVLINDINLPKLPQVRVDSPEIEAKNSIANSLMELSQKNLKSKQKTNAILSGINAGNSMGTGVAGGAGTGQGNLGSAGTVLQNGVAGDMLSKWEYLYSQKAAPTTNYVTELRDQLKYQTLIPILEGVKGNPTAFLNVLDAPLLSAKWPTFQDPINWENSLVNYVKTLGGENLRSSMMLEASRGVPFDPNQMVWAKVIGTIKSLSDAELGLYMSRHPELRDLQTVKNESVNYGGPTLNALMDVVGASISIQEDGTISVSGESVKKAKAATTGRKPGDRLDSGDVGDYVSKWAKKFYGEDIEKLYDQYIMVGVSQGEVASRQFWAKYPQLAQYQEFSKQIWDRYNKTKSGPKAPARHDPLKDFEKIKSMMTSRKSVAKGDSFSSSYKLFAEIIRDRGVSKLPSLPSIRNSSGQSYGGQKQIDGSVYANVISVIKAKNPQLAIAFGEFIQANPTRRQALLQANPDLSRYITLFTAEQLGEIEYSYNMGLEIGGDSLSRGGGVRVYKRRTGRTGL